MLIHHHLMSTAGRQRTADLIAAADRHRRAVGLVKLLRRRSKPATPPGRESPTESPVLAD